MEDSIEPIDYAIYGSLLSLVSVIASTESILDKAMQSRDRTVLSGCVVVAEGALRALAVLPPREMSQDARKQFEGWATQYRDYAADVASGKRDASALFREFDEGLTILNIALDRLGRRLGFSGSDE